MTKTKPQTIHRYLPNGMEIYLERRTTAPLVAAQAWVKVGSNDEAPDESGISHVLEHMLFKGTDRFPESGAVAKAVEQAGGDINAYTRQQETVYHITAPNPFTSSAIEILFEILFHSHLNADELQRELLVVLEEEKRLRDNPSGVASLALFGSIYNGTPLERPIIGTPEVIASFTREKISEFYNKWYRPNNMVLVVVGDFNLESLYADILTRAESIAPGSIPERAPKQISTPQPLSQSAKLVKGEWQDVRGRLAVPTPALENNQFLAWNILASILGEGDTSRLTQSVHEAQGLVGAIGASLFVPRSYYGILGISFYCEEEKTIDALTAIVEEIASLAETGPTKAEMERVVYCAIAGRIFDAENLENRASNVAFALLTPEKLRFEEQYIEKLKQLSPADIQKAAKEFLEHLRLKRYALILACGQKSQLVDKNVEWNIGVSLPTSGADSDTERQPLPVHSNTSVSSLNPDIRQITLPLPGERTLRVNIRESRESPIASCVLATRGGSSSESETKTGVSHLAAQMLTRGTTRLTYNAIAEELENRAATLGAFASADTMGMQLVTLEEHVVHLFRIFLESFLTPAFPADQWERIHSDTMLGINAGRDNPAQIIQQMQARSLFGDHPYGRTLSGSETIVAALRKEDAAQYWSDVLANHTFVLSLAGALPVDRLVQDAHAAFTRFYESLSNQTRTPPQFDFPKEPGAIGYPRFGHHHMDRQQVHMSLAYRTVPIHDSRRLAFDLAATILSGQSGRLFMDLRDTRGFAYTVGADHQQYALAGTFCAYIATSPVNVKEGLDGIKEHLQRLANHEPDAQEVERAQNLLIAGRAIDAQHISFQARQLTASELHELPFDYFLTFSERVLAVTASEISNAMRTILESQEPSLVLVGPEGMWLPSAPPPPIFDSCVV